MDGIRLSPAYDVNPSIERRELSLAINEVETACDVSILMDACRDYGLSTGDAAGVLNDVCVAVGEWQSVAKSLGIPASEQALMASAFAA